MRPAVFIKDLRKRATVLEEEKQQHRERLKAKQDSPSKLAQIKTDQSEPSNKIMKSLTERTKKLKTAVESKDISKVADAIYDHKTTELVEPFDDRK